MLFRRAKLSIGSDMGPCDRIQPQAPERGATLTEARQDRGRLYNRTIRGCRREGFQDQDRTLQAPSNDRRTELLTAGYPVRVRNTTLDHRHSSLAGSRVRLAHPTNAGYRPVQDIRREITE